MAIVGEIVAFAFGGRDESDPQVQLLRSQGWLACEGQSVAQAGRTGLPTLFAAIGKSWGSTDPNNTFCLPDFRGRFLRGWSHGSGQDPDAAQRTSIGANGARGDAVGSAQEDELQRHSHGLCGTFPADQNNNASDRPTVTMGSLPSLGESGGGNETRPRNAYVMYCIFTGVSPVPPNIKFFV